MEALPRLAPFKMLGAALALFLAKLFESGRRDGALLESGLDLERWNLVSLEALRLALDNKHCKAGLATENACTKRELATKIWIPVMSHFCKNLLCWRALQRHVASPARCHKQYDAIVSTRLDLVYPPEVCANL